LCIENAYFLLQYEAEGGLPADPAAYVKRVNALLA